ncbi:exosomal polycystin-1-interacting protein-like [Embiotoca jacksoni]|uniref:exosomal polycystin-1-interacting protein-like n=1 Tax=Embiotoca jacksoni TaxID=100190 RepID=UPI0037038BC2
MEMSPNAVSSAPSSRSPRLLFLFLTLAAVTTSSAPAYHSSPPVNATLLFAAGSNLRNCSCSEAVRDCDEVLANSRCRCHTVLRSSLPPAGLRQPGALSVWVKELWVLEELLNGSAVGHLRLSFCGVRPVDGQYLVLLGLRTLRIHSAAEGTPYPDQEVTVSSPVSLDLSSSLHVTYLDVALLNGLSALKAYSVAGPPAAALSQHFPHLAPPPSLLTSDPVDPGDPAAEPLQDLLVTFVY